METSEIRIVNTTAEDINFVYWLFEEAINYQKKNGYPAWKNYDKEALRAEIENHLQYKILRGEDVLGIFSIAYADPGTWGEYDTGSALFLHRTISNPNFKGSKTFGKIKDWAIHFAKQKGLQYIRMDTWSDNPDLIEFYKSHGFKVVASRVTSNSTDLPKQNRNLNVTLLEIKAE